MMGATNIKNDDICLNISSCTLKTKFCMPTPHSIPKENRINNQKYAKIVVISLKK